MAKSNTSLKYISILAYTDNNYKSFVGKYEAMINPDKYTETFHVKWNDRQSPGTSNTSIKFQNSPPADISFDLLFDGTGILSKKRTDVAAEIKKFKHIAYHYTGTIHSPNYLKLQWGKGLSMQCRMSSMSISYTLFRSDGSPLRAKATVTFKNYESPKKIEAKAKKQSPDMTHEREIKAGDTLPALTYSIYGDSQYYLKVAAYNKLDNFRQLVPGTKLYFPPLI